MARPSLRKPDQPFPVRFLLGLYEFFASLKLAVSLILTLAGVLAFATLVESNVGSQAARWYVYHANWFLWLLALLAINIFCAASIRYPWKRHQTGFVITHVGLLTVLFGSAVSFRGSLNSQLLVYEGDTGSIAVDIDGGGYLRFDHLPGRDKRLYYRVDAGPFNWDELKPAEMRRRIATLFGQDNYPEPWRHPLELIFEHDDTKVEIVDFYSRSEVKRLPHLALRFEQPKLGFEMPIDLQYDDKKTFAQASFAAMGRIFMWRTDDAIAFRAFTQCTPQRTVTDDGTVVVWLDGEVFHLNVSTLQQRRKEGTPVPLDDHTTIELVKYAPTADISQLGTTNHLGSVGTGTEARLPAVELLVREKTDGQEMIHHVIRFADLPFLPSPGALPHFTAEFYHPSSLGRISILEGPENQLSFRAWQQKQGRVVTSGPLKLGEPVDTWSMGGGENVWKMTLLDYHPRTTDDETTRIFSTEFDKTDRGISRRVKVRITSGQKVDEFWLHQNSPIPWQDPDNAQIHETEIALGTTIRSTYRVDETDIGFEMTLDKFDLRVDPGAAMASNYTSEITINDKRRRHDESKPLKTIVTMNQPLDYPDPHGRTLRFFQENYLKPDNGSPAGSIFRVNYDPGRWLKYLGSLLVTVGIFLMFYMRAYFVKPAEPAKRKTV